MQLALLLLLLPKWLKDNAKESFFLLCIHFSVARKFVQRTTWRTGCVLINWNINSSNVVYQKCDAARKSDGARGNASARIWNAFLINQLSVQASSLQALSSCQIHSREPRISTYSLPIPTEAASLVLAKMKNPPAEYKHYALAFFLFTKHTVIAILWPRFFIPSPAFRIASPR